jgi:hypothetical protein
MYGEAALTTAAIRTIFTEEIALAGGRVSDLFEDQARLFARSVLPWHREVKRADSLQGGVALRATRERVWVHPYVFRQVCSNGAIAAQAVESRELSDLIELPEEEAAAAVREAVRACCVEDALADFSAQARSASDVEADLVLNLMPLLSRLSQGDASSAFRAIIDRFTSDRDFSRYGLMNAVTAVARDTRDPELRWNLEEFGGAVPTLQDEPHQCDPSVVARMGRAVQFTA